MDGLRAHSGHHGCWPLGWTGNPRDRAELKDVLLPHSRPARSICLRNASWIQVQICVADGNWMKYAVTHERVPVGQRQVCVLGDCRVNLARALHLLQLRCLHP